MLKELLTPQNANVFVGKLGDILFKAIDQHKAGSTDPKMIAVDTQLRYIINLAAGALDQKGGGGVALFPFPQVRN